MKDLIVDELLTVPPPIATEDLELIELLAGTELEFEKEEKILKSSRNQENDTLEADQTTSNTGGSELVEGNKNENDSNYELSYSFEEASYSEDDDSSYSELEEPQALREKAEKEAEEARKRILQVTFLRIKRRYLIILVKISI